jgi:hypothetical protein
VGTVLRKTLCHSQAGWPEIDLEKPISRLKQRAVAFIFLASLLFPGVLRSEAVSVRHAEGLVHGFLVLGSLDGTNLAGGDLIQTSQGDRVTTRLVFHFKDGSIRDETAVFTQSGRFRLLTDHMIQRGPTFPHPMEVSIEAVSGRVTVRYRDDHGKEKTTEKQMPLPDDLANGIVVVLLKNILSSAGATKVSMVVATPKPRLVKLVITPAGEVSFSAGGSPHKAVRFNVKVELGGLLGLIAPVLGKQPQDTSVWVLGGEAPGFVKSEGPMYQGGPLWRIELASPLWPR